MANAIDLFNSFQRRAKSLEGTRVRIEKQYLKGKIQKSDLNLMYAGIFIKLINSFELFIEELYIGLLTQKVLHSTKNVKPVYIFKNKTQAIELLCGNQAFIKWMPYDNVKKNSEIHFKTDIPFKTLNKNDIDILNRASCIRNAIAHTSQSSLDKLQRNVLNGTRLKAHEKNAIGYLRSVYMITPHSVRYQELSGALEVITRKLC